MGMILRQIFDEPISGYWDGGKKAVFDWKIDWNRQGEDHNGKYVRVGSWGANHWFNVSLGKADKRTLSYAKRKLNRWAKMQGRVCKFEYIEEE